MDINRTVLLQGNHLLADLLAERNNHQKICFKGGDLLYHVRRIDIFGFDTGNVVPGTPEINICMMGLTAMAACRSCGLCKHTDQFMATVMNGFQTRDAELC
jgi:hypothetical protein